MVSESWDGKRVYFTSSLLANWDKTAPAGGDLQFLKALPLGRQNAEAGVFDRLHRRKTWRTASDALRCVLVVRQDGANDVGESRVT